MTDAQPKKPKRGPIVPRMAKPPSIEKVREILDQMAPESVVPVVPAVLEIGQYYEGQGVYVGRWTPHGLTKTFNVFAAPEDLPETMKYVDALKYIAHLKDWHGHDGTNYANDKEIRAALEDGSYNGGWIIPTLGILKENLYPNKDTGSLRSTFNTTSSGSVYPGWYWSCTEPRGNPSDVWDVRFSDGGEYWDHKDDDRSSCRPVRLVPINK